MGREYEVLTGFGRKEVFNAFPRNYVLRIDSRAFLEYVSLCPFSGALGIGSMDLGLRTVPTRVQLFNRSRRVDHSVGWTDNRVLENIGEPS